MVAFSFQSWKAAKVESGESTQTIRAVRKRGNPKSGDRLQLFVGQRTRNCRKLIETDPVCSEVIPVRLFLAAGEFHVFLDGEHQSSEQVESLAHADGFDSSSAFFDFLGPRLPFDGLVIRWQTS